MIAPSEGRLRAIVEHPAIADTHHIDRQRYTLAPDVPRPARRHGLITAGGAVAVGLVDRLALLLAMLAGMCVLVGPPVSEHSLERAAVVTVIAAGVAALVAIAAH